MDNAKPRPRFSVIIPAYDAARTLAVTVASVLAQNAPAHEIIVVDDGSADDTAGVARGFGGALRVHRQVNGGISAARNAGAAMATGEWLAFLDADDRYYPWRLAEHQALLARHPELELLVGDYDYCRPDGTRIARSMERSGFGREVLARGGDGGGVVLAPGEMDRFIASYFGHTLSFSIRRELFHRAGGYPPGIGVGEDLNLLIRACASCTGVGVSTRPLGAYVVHEAGAVRSDRLHAQRETVRALGALKAPLRTARPEVRRGLQACLRGARLDLAHALVRGGRRLEAARAAAALLTEAPGWQSLRSVLSVLRG